MKTLGKLLGGPLVGEGIALAVCPQGYLRPWASDKMPECIREYTASGEPARDTPAYPGHGSALIGAHAGVGRREGITNGAGRPIAVAAGTLTWRLI